MAGEQKCEARESEVVIQPSRSSAATCGRPEAEGKRNLIPEDFKAYMDYQKVWTKAVTDNLARAARRMLKSIRSTQIIIKGNKT